MFSALDSQPPELWWGLFSRGLGLLYLISFISLNLQLIRGAGRGGGMPIALRLDRIREDFDWRRVFYFPTLLWISPSDLMLRLLGIAGVIGAGMLIYGGELALPGLIICYICYLSLDMAVGLIFPWDCLMFEASVLALFLPATHPLPELAATATPPPLLAWAFRLLLFRVMFGFGKQKFLGSTNKDLAYLKGFLTAQPLPSKLGWYHQKLPGFMLKALVVFMFIAEIPVPFFFLIPGDLSIIAAFVTIFLMVGIQAMGSFGYFSMLTMVACLPLFDNVTPTQLTLSGLFAEGAPVFTHAFVLLHTFGVLFAFPFNSWVGQCWHLWSTWYRLPLWGRWPFALFRTLHPFRWLHPYGVFPPNTSPGAKMSLLVEVSWDDEEWHELEFTFSPSNEHSPPRFVAPHHPRGDQAVIYETFGLNPTSLISSMLGPYDPYSFGTQPAARVLLQRILEGTGSNFMRPGVLAQHAQPPRSARVTTVMLEPASLEEHRKSGKWWKRSYIGPHSPPQQRDPLFWDNFLPEPELWHPENIFWRRRSRLKPLMDRSLQGEDPLKLVLEEQQGLTQQDVDLFWDEFIPSITREQRENLDSLAEVVAQLHERYDRRQQKRLARVLGRLSILLLARLEPHYLGKGFAAPPIPAKTYFHLWMATQDVIAGGRDAYSAVCADPLSIRDYLSELTPQRGLYLLSIFRFDSMVFEAQKLRLVTAFMPPYGADAERFNDYDSMTKTEQLVVRLSENVSGFFNVMPTIRASFKGPRFDRGYPELYPSFTQLESGEVVLDRHAEAPEGAEALGEHG